MKYRNYTEEELNKLHSTEISILQEIIRVCKENEIPYFTVGGTTLGCIRHDGFIPWDDDIDIGMLRNDYEKFLLIAPQKLSEGYSLQHFSVEKNAPTYFAKVRKDDTKFVEKSTRHLNVHQGVFVDIMPFDNVPDDMRERKKFYKTVWILLRLQIAKTNKVSVAGAANFKKAVSAVFKRIIHLLLKPVPKKYLDETLDKKIRMYNNMVTNTISSRATRKHECSREDIFPTKSHKFENIEVLIPNNTDKILKTLYGDYMKLPAEEKRVNHAPYNLKI